MEPSASASLTSLLESAADGDSEAHARFWTLCYRELHAIAARQLASWRDDPIQPTDLLHDVYARLFERTEVSRKGRSYFFASFAKECRRVVVDRWRQEHSLRRGGGHRRLTCVTDVLADRVGDAEVDLLQLTDLLDRLAEHDPRGAEVAELRIFSPMDNATIAEHLGVSLRTVEADWNYARSWIARELSA